MDDRIEQVQTEDHYRELKRLFMEYAENLGFDLSFQGFEEEMENLPVQYGPPLGGAFLLMAGHEAVGCIGIRQFETGIAEIKRMYIQPRFRGKGYGKQLLDASISKARVLGYQKIWLDTLESMKQANIIYRKAGFYRIPAYRPNPFPGARFYELTLPDLPDS